jgi:hypothetical protein
MKDMKYLRAFINGTFDLCLYIIADEFSPAIETLRLYPPV